MKKGNIEFKGIKEGIYLVIQKGSFEELECELDTILKKSDSFFKGGKVIGIKSKILTSQEKSELLNIIKYRYGLDVDTEDLSDHVKELLDINLEKKVKNQVFEGIGEGVTKFINSTIRSGQMIDFKGNVVIVGDVNPGGHIKAEGNVIVLGRLNGIAHAGSSGNTDALVAAYELQPTQLRIANKITRRPDGEVKGEEIPEVARIEKGEIYIQPYLSRRQ